MHNKSPAWVAFYSVSQGDESCGDETDIGQRLILQASTQLETASLGLTVDIVYRQRIMFCVQTCIPTYVLYTDMHTAKEICCV